MPASVKALALDASEQTLFLLSDVHAGAFSGDREAQIRQRLDIVYKAADQVDGRVVILGDLFDYWQESSKYVPDRLQEWVDFFDIHHKSVTNTVLITGNHDHWAGSVLSGRGFALVDDHIAVYTRDAVYFLLHGDGIPDEKLKLSRSGLNAQFRKPSHNRLFQLLPIRFRTSVMRRFSNYRKQRDENGDEAIQIEEKLAEWLQKTSYDGVIWGHTHKLLRRNIGDKLMLNLGTFYDDECVVVISNDGIRITNVDQLIDHVSPDKPYIRVDGK